MEEKMRILKMVEEGKISAEQAVGLLDALGEAVSREAGSQGKTSDDKWVDLNVSKDTPYEKKMLRIVVDSPDGDKVKVQFPVNIIRQILKVTGKLPIQGEGMQSIDLDALTASVLECLDNETLGNIVDVNAADGTIVKVFIG